MTSSPKVSFLSLIPMIYLALWTSVFGVWSFVDGAAVFEAFGLDLRADEFILQNSGARYLGIGAAMWVAILVFRTREALVTALLARMVMDILDVVAGIRTGILDPIPTGLLQSFCMFIGPGLLGIYLIYRQRD